MVFEELSVGEQTLVTITRGNYIYISMIFEILILLILFILFIYLITKKDKGDNNELEKGN